MAGDTLEDILKQFDQSQDQIDEHTIDAAIRKLQPKDKEREPSFEYKAERMAFSFDERSMDEHEGPYKWFAPMISGQQKDGTPFEWPSIEHVDKQMLNYWADRARKASHPVMRARYAGLTWEFTPMILGKSADIDMARIRIDAVTDLTRDDCHTTPVEVLQKLGHTFKIAMSINDTARIDQMREAIISYEKRVGEDSKAGLWGHAYDLLLGNKKSAVTEEQMAGIIQDLEDRLERLSDTSKEGSVEPWAADAAAQRLAFYYRKTEKTEDVKRVLLKVGSAFDHIASKAPAMTAQAWYEGVERTYRRFGLTKEAGILRRKIAELGPAVHDGLVRHTQEMEIKKEDMDAYIEDALKGDLTDVIRRLVIDYIPRRKQTEKQLEDLAKSAVMLFLVKRKILDHKGRPVAVLGSLEEDLDGHVIAQTAQNIGFTAVFLRAVLEALIDRFEADTHMVLSWVDECPLFDPTKRDILQRGITAYLDGDYILALHLLVPQIEDTIRTLVEKAGGDVWESNKLGGLNYRPLGRLLRSPELIELFGSDVSEYWQILYTDPRGLNIRNNMCHGMMPTDAFGMEKADRVFHTLLILCQIRSGPKKPDEGDGDSEG